MQAPSFPWSRPAAFEAPGYPFPPLGSAPAAPSPGVSLSTLGGGLPWLSQFGGAPGHLHSVLFVFSDRRRSGVGRVLDT